MTHLGHLLSDDADIFLPGSSGYRNATARWSNIFEPQLAAVVMPTTEQDVQLTVKYANARNMTFFTIGGGHAATRALERVVDGIGIWTRAMRKITISGSEATIQAGAESGEVKRVFFESGKQGVTTGCDCVGFMSPILGGGHGWLQGRYGLLADNLISARMVLANSSIITVSAEHNADLFWAIRGAGQNFGIVASVKYRVYDRTPDEDDWAYEEYVFSHDKLEALYDIANSLLPSAIKEPPVQLTHYAHFEIVPDIDPDNPIIRFWVIWQGMSIPPEYTKPLHELEPLSIKADVVDATQLNGVAGAAYNSQACGHNLSIGQFPVNLRSYNTTALRKAMGIFASMPAWLNSSSVLLEGYSTAGVRRVPAESTAYPDRFNTLLISPLMVYNNTEEAAGAEKKYETMLRYAEGMREALRAGSGEPLHAYVNYAFGDESSQAVYGYDEWRLARLRRLNARYDPQGKFNFHKPFE
ncbi:FAD-binding domain-containing protein [Xylariomycetidae sp. FL2044]|nr:FAD-binding domain-containing protein [Xylariomycetidae sp. FL2044]